MSIAIPPLLIDINVLTDEVTMRPWFFALGLSLALLNPPHLQADDPPLPANAGIAWPPQTMPEVQPLLAAPVVPPQAVGPQFLDTEVLLGFPTEVRIQGAALRRTDTALLLEGIVGVEVLPLSIAVGFVGVGGRIRCAVRNGERNAFVMKPGADIYGLFSTHGIGNLPVGGADVELLWWHSWGASNRFGFESGVDVGAFFGTFGSDWFAFPMVSAIVGLHF